MSIERESAAATTDTPSSIEPNNEQVAAAATVNAGKLVIEFEGNEVRANQIYGGKRIRINGSVNSIDVLKDGRITLTFHSPAGGYAHTRCYFNKSQSSRLAQLAGGQQAIVEGTVRGLGGGLTKRVMSSWKIASCLRTSPQTSNPLVAPHELTIQALLSERVRLVRFSRREPF